MSAPGKQAARAIFAAAVAAVEPRAAVLAHCRVEAGVLAVGERAIPLAGVRQAILVGAGKASAAMAQAVEELLGDRLSGGVVVVKHDHRAPLRRVAQLEAAHPVPDAAGEAGARAIEAAVTGLDARDLVIACWSGGASALTPAPRAGLTLADKQAVTRLLLASGADIRAVNAVRKHLSRLKGGQLAQRTAPARVVCLAISDVVGDDLATIGSGPFVPDPSTFAEVQELVRRFGLEPRLPPAVAALLARGLDGAEPETPKPGAECFAGISHHLVASNHQAVEAAAAAARALGYEPVVWRQPLTGEARGAAATFAAAALHQARRGRRACLIAGGETTVTLGEASGRGGRNQEFALACAGMLAGSDGITVLAGGTDGSDGPTDAAGALADGGTMARAHALGLDLERHLAGHDAYPFFAALGDLLVTGPTGTNVMDVDIAVIG